MIQESMIVRCGDISRNDAANRICGTEVGNVGDS